MTEFKAGDELVHVYGYPAPVKVKRVYADVYEIDYGSDVETQIVAKRDAHACYRRRLRAPHAPPESFRQVFCAWTGQTPVKPEPELTALQRVRQGVLDAARRYSNGHASVSHIDSAIDRLILEAKAEALAELEGRPIEVGDVVTIKPDMPMPVHSPARHRVVYGIRDSFDGKPYALYISVAGDLGTCPADWLVRVK